MAADFGRSPKPVIDEILDFGPEDNHLTAPVSQDAARRLQQIVKKLQEINQRIDDLSNRV